MSPFPEHNVRLVLRMRHFFSPGTQWTPTYLEMVDWKKRASEVFDNSGLRMGGPIRGVLSLQPAHRPGASWVESKKGAEWVLLALPAVLHVRAAVLSSPRQLFLGVASAFFTPHAFCLKERRYRNWPVSWNKNRPWRVDTESPPYCSPWNLQLNRLKKGHTSDWLSLLFIPDSGGAASYN